MNLHLVLLIKIEIWGFLVIFRLLSLLSSMHLIDKVWIKEEHLAIIVHYQVHLAVACVSTEFVKTQCKAPDPEVPTSSNSERQQEMIPNEVQLQHTMVMEACKQL